MAREWRRVLSYCVVTFVISWGGIFLLIGPGAVTLDAANLPILLGLGYVAMLLGPSVAAVAVTAALDGRPGLRALRDSLVTWRFAGRWWAIGALTAPVSITALLFALSFASPGYVPRLVVEGDRAALLGYVAVSATLTGVFEELGWTGFVVRTLLSRHGVVRTGVIVGLLMAAWNFLIVYVKELSLPTPGVLGLGIVLAVGLLTWQVAYRVLMVWVYDRTRSLLLAMLMQTSLVAAWTALTPLGLDQTTLVIFYILLTAIWCVAAAAVLRSGLLRDERDLEADVVAHGDDLRDRGLRLPHVEVGPLDGQRRVRREVGAGALRGGFPRRGLGHAVDREVAVDGERPRSG